VDADLVSGARYYAGKDGRRYVYATDATYRCEWALGPPPDVLATALAGGLSGLPVMFARAHQRAPRLRALDANSKPTDFCDTCGAKLRKVGYRAWVEAPYADVVAEFKRLGETDEAEQAEMAARIESRLGGDGYGRWPNSERYFGLKREAISWTREQASLVAGAE
jgi:hypothetical protein